MKFTTFITVFVGLLSATSTSATAGSIMKRQIPDINTFYDYLMCSGDKPERLLTSARVAHMNMTVSKCLQICFILGPYQFAGVEYGVDCFCGRNASRKLMKPATDCNMACGGNKTEMCGGYWRISLYGAVGTEEQNSSSSNRPVDCKETYDKGERSNGVYTIYPKGGITGYQVYCDMTTDGGGWTVFQRRFNGSVDFYRTWNEYTYGFGDVNGEYWLGNEKIHELTSQGPQTLRIDMMDRNGTWKYAVYEGFSISGNSTGYALTVGTYNGTAGNALKYHNGETFKTRDRELGNTCATKFTGAWWYKSCHAANLNGIYNNNELGKGIIWYPWHGHRHSMNATEMKIRRM